MIDPKTVWSSSQLPTLPTVAVRLLEMSKNPDIEIQEIVNCIKADPAISAKILKATNSSYFGFRSEVTSLERAVPLLGATVVTSLALSFSLVDAAMSKGELVKHYQEYWMQSVVQATAANILGELCVGGLECEYFLCGLLCDIGRLATLKTMPDQYREVINECAETKEPLHVVEQRRFGFDHVEIGAKLAEFWKLAPVIQDVIRYHHADIEHINAVRSLPHFEIIRVGAVASAIGDYYVSPAKGESLQRIRALWSQVCDRDESEVEQLLVRVCERVKTAANLFSASASLLCTASELTAEANEQLAQLAMREHLANTQAMERQRETEKQNAELTSKNEELQMQAVYDGLTAVYNRKYFDETLAKEVHRSARTATPIGLIFADADHFKQINDTHGHRAGDAILKAIAQRLTSSVRDADTVARYGGEEFVVIVSQPSEHGLQRLAERIRSLIESPPIEFEGITIPVTVSLGAVIALPNRELGDLVTRLLESADEAMYEAKRNGRNRCCFRSLLTAEERRLHQLVAQRRFSRWLVTQKIFDIPTMSQVLLSCRPNTRTIGELAVSRQYLSQKDVARILQLQNTSHKRFGECAIELGLLTEVRLAELLAFQAESPHDVAKALVQLGICHQSDVILHLRQFLAESLPAGSPSASPSSETTKPTPQAVVTG